MQYLFSYGTLQKEKVQLESFGRILNGYADALPGFTLSNIEITNADVLATSQQQFHPIAIRTEHQRDLIQGIVFEVTEEELVEADKYEVDDYVRIKAILMSGKEAWVYVTASNEKG